MARFIIGAHPALCDVLADVYTQDGEVELLQRFPDRLVVDMPDLRAMALRSALGPAVRVEPDFDLSVGPIVPAPPPI